MSLGPADGQRQGQTTVIPIFYSTFEAQYLHPFDKVHGVVISAVVVYMADVMEKNKQKHNKKIPQKTTEG